MKLTKKLLKLCTIIVFTVTHTACTNQVKQEPEEEQPITCAVPPPIEAPDEEKKDKEHPWKDGDYWDQGTVGACVTTSIVNMNISLFGKDCDKKGKLFKAIQNCMFKKGHTETWLRGIYLTNQEGKDLRECKKEAVASSCGKKITWTGVNKNPGFPPPPKVGGVAGGFTKDPDAAGPKKSPCELIKAQLTPAAGKKGGAWAAFTLANGTRHMVSIESIDCTTKKMVIRNPNNPNQLETYNFNDNGTLSGGTPKNQLDNATMDSWVGENVQ